MNIAIVTPGTLPVPPIKGGAVENLVYTLVRENEFSNEPLQIDVYSIEDDKLIETKQEINTKYFYVNKEKDRCKIIKNIKSKIEIRFNKFNFVTKVVNSMKGKKYEWVIVENRPQYILQLKNCINSKIILHMHNEHLTSFKDYSRAIDACYKIVVVSEYIKFTILKRYNISEKKIEVLNNGVDIKRFNIEGADKKKLLRERYNLKESDFVIIFSGRLVREKGIIELLKSFNKVNKIYNMKLLIVGASWFSNDFDDKFTIELKSIAKESLENIIFTGYVNYDEIHNVYNTADIAVLPSIWNDPFPLTILECMAVGLPIISTQSGGIPEMLDNKCGILLPIDENIIENLSESIEYLFKNKNIREKMKNLSREKVKLNFSTEVFYNNFLDLLN